MANSVDEFLKNSSPEQQDRFKDLVRDTHKEGVLDGIKGENADTTPKTAVSTTAPRPTGLEQQTPNANTMEHIQTVQQSGADAHDQTGQQKTPNAVDQYLSNQEKNQTKDAGQTLQNNQVKAQEPEGR